MSWAECGRGAGGEESKQNVNSVNLHLSRVSESLLLVLGMCLPL